MGPATLFSFREQAWAGSHWIEENGLVDQVESKDFRSLRTLGLKLRGVKGGEKIAVVWKTIKPHDGGETKVRLTWRIKGKPLISREQFFSYPYGGATLTLLRFRRKNQAYGDLKWRRFEFL